MKRLLPVFLFLVFFTFSCVDNDNHYEVPTTYDFSPMNYQGQLDRLGMLQEIKDYINTTLDGNVLDIGRLASMYANSNPATAQWVGTYGATKQLKDKTAATESILFDDVFENAATDSQSSSVASEGTPGLITSLDGSKTYFVNANGLEYAQAIEKGLMGAVFMYQATAIYLGAERMDVDNEEMIEGQGTKMEHHWDESFGYLGVPTDFPTNKDGLVFWGKYCDNRNAVLTTNHTIMDAYIAGRAAISNNDLNTRDRKITEIREQWDVVAASTSLHYINSAISNFNDMAIRAHALTEAAAFAYSIPFNPESKANQTEINNILEMLGGSSEFLSMNFYNTSLSDLENAKNTLAQIYNWEDLKNQF